MENIRDMKFRNIITYALWVIILTFIYMVLRENFTITTLLVGFGLSIASLIVCILFFGKTFIARYQMKLIPMIWYLVNLIIIIITSGIKSLVLGLFYQTTSTLIEYKSTLKNDMLITLLANSITLTPGTVIIDKANNTLKFMKLYKKQSASDINDVKYLEKILMKVEVDIK
ncbi:MAG: Na+/H+ antiporter subunit E [Clostridiales bacterium]|nr:Na+/H+ antiporter subunit E [Clostridiales bacterium]